MNVKAKNEQERLNAITIDDDEPDYEPDDEYTR